MKPALAARLFALVAFFLAATTCAANQPPERFLAFPDLALARGETPAAIPLTTHLRDPDVPGTAARITVRMAGQTRTIDLALHDAEAPLTVANFVAYVNGGRYAANFFHRSVPGFIIQNGGFYFLNDTTFDFVPTYEAVKNEPGRSNLRGTVAMANLGRAPDRATSPRFINLADNSTNLDAQNGGFTVFAHVLGDGMTVADAIAATPRYNVSNLASAWTDLPLTTGALARTNFIETDTAIIPTLSHVVTSDDPDLVTATLENGVLRLAASASRSGSTTIRISTTDLEGGTLTSAFAVTVAKAGQSIAFTLPASATFGDTPLSLSATASSGLPVTLTLVSGPANLSDNTLTFTGAGTVVVRATQAGDANQESALSVERTITVARADQSIDFTPPTSATFGDAPLSLSATASSGLPVTLTLESGPATLSGSTLTLNGAGSFILRATQIGDANHNPAPAVERTLTVAKAPQSITFTPPASATFGDAPPTLTASASSALPVSFTLVSGPATLSGSTLALTGAGNVVLRATQAGDANHNPAPTIERTLIVAPTSSARIALPARNTPYAGAPQPALATTTPAGLRVTYTYKLGTAPAVDTAPTLPGVYTVTATLDDPAASNKPTATATLNITKAPLTISGPVLDRLVSVANPAFTLSYSGLVGADTPATALTRAPVAATKATTKSAPGTYPVTLTGGASDNYTLTLVPGSLTVVGLGGTYEALLLDESFVPTGKLTLTIPANALSYTGTLTLAREPKGIPVASSSKSPGTTIFTGSAEFANAAATWTRTANGLDALELALTIYQGSIAGSLERNGQPFATLAHGATLRTFTKGETAPGAGANTLSLYPAQNLFAGGRPLPGGSGYATAAIAPTTGVLTLKGAAADGSPLTASVKPNRNDTYLLWVNPYGTRAESFLAGPLPLETHPETTRFPGRYFVPLRSGRLSWKKAALPANTPTSKLDKSYRAGFGPLGVQVSLDPWLPPAAKASGAVPAGTLAQRLGLAANATTPGALAISHGPEDLDLGARENLLPFEATLSPAGVLTAANAAATAWTIKITPNTGAFTGSFTLSDQLSPAPAKPVSRKVTFSGVLRQAPAEDSEVATGFFLVPGFPVPKGSAPAEQPSGEIRLSAP